MQEENSQIYTTNGTESLDQKEDNKAAWTIRIDQEDKVEELADESDSSDWSDMEEARELRKQFQRMILEDESKASKIKNFDQHDESLDRTTAKSIQIQQPIQNKTITMDERMKQLSLELQEGQTMTKVGTVHAILHDQVIIQSMPNLILDYENFLFAPGKILLGPIDEILGNIKNPIYTVKKDAYLKGILMKPNEVKIITSTEMDQENLQNDPEKPSASATDTTRLVLAEGDSIFVIASKIKLIYQDQIEKLKKESKKDAFDFKPEFDDVDCMFSDDDAEMNAHVSRKLSSHSAKKNPIVGNHKQRKRRERNDAQGEQDYSERHIQNMQPSYPLQSMPFPHISQFQPPPVNLNMAPLGYIPIQPQMQGQLYQSPVFLNPPGYQYPQLPINQMMMFAPGTINLPNQLEYNAMSQQVGQMYGYVMAPMQGFQQAPHIPDQSGAHNQGAQPQNLKSNRQQDGGHDNSL